MINHLNDIFQVADDREQSDFAMAYYSPKFFWVMRDVDSKILDSKGNPVTPNQHLETVLTSVESTPKNSPTIKVRQNILNIFKKRESLVFPNVKKAKGIKDLTPHSLTQIYKLRERIYSKTTPK